MTSLIWKSDLGVHTILNDDSSSWMMESLATLRGVRGACPPLPFLLCLGWNYQYKDDERHVIKKGRTWQGISCGNKMDGARQRGANLLPACSWFGTQPWSCIPVVRTQKPLHQPCHPGWRRPPHTLVAELPTLGGAPWTLCQTPPPMYLAMPDQQETIQP